MTPAVEPRTGGAWRKALIVGLDGFSLRLVRDLVPAGSMPHLTALLERGIAGPLESVLPTQSAPAWASFFTGQLPGRHGVFDFLERHPDGRYRHARPPARECLWRVLASHGLRTGLLNFPVLYPPSPIDGFMVAGMLVPDGAVFAYPPELGDHLLEVIPDYRIDTPWQFYAGREAALLRALETSVGQRLAAAESASGRYPVDCLAIAFLSPDRLHHAMWRHLDPEHPDHDPVEAARWQARIGRYYETLDAAIGRLTRTLEPGTGVILLSDHGFQAASRQFQVDAWLGTKGWMTTKRASRWVRFVRRLERPRIQALRRRLIPDVSRHLPVFAPGGAVDWSRTVAYCPWTVQQGIRLNLRGRDPHGIVEPGPGARALLERIRQALLQATDPHTEQRVVAEVWDGAEYFGGSAHPLIPDLAFTLRPGYASSPHRPGLWERSRWPSGDHSLEGFWAVTGPGVAPDPLPRPARLVDVAPTLTYLLGAPIPRSVDGRARIDLLTPEAQKQYPARFGEMEGAPDRDRDDGQGLTKEQDDALRRRLRGLGYL